MNTTYKYKAALNYFNNAQYFHSNISGGTFKTVHM